MQELKIICPHCDSLTTSGRQDPKCYVNEEKGVYHCFHCKAKGKSSDLEEESLQAAERVEKKEFNPDDVLSLLSLRLPAEALSYLERRFPGLSLGEVINKGELMYSAERNAIAFPTKDIDGYTVGVKYRSLDPEAKIRWLAEPGSRIGCYTLKGNNDKLLIVEGQMDALTAKLGGFEGTVIALESTHLNSTVISEIRRFNSVFIMLDNDGPGREAQAKALFDLKYLGLKAVNLPEKVKDLNELLTAEGATEFKSFINTKFKSDNEQVTLRVSDRLNSIYSTLLSKDSREGRSTGWNNLDMILDGGFRESDYIIVNSYMKSGKTTFVNNLSVNHMSQDKKVALASFEMDPDSETFLGAINLAGGIDVFDIKEDQVQDHVSKTIINNKWLNNLIVLNKHGKTMWDEVKKWLDYIVGKYEIDLIILDHAGFMIKDMKDATENINLHANAKQFAVENRVPVVMVTQTPKPAKDRFGNLSSELDMYSSYGGAGAGIACNHYFTLKRDPEARDLLEVTLKGSRNRRALVGEKVILTYDRNTGRLSEEINED